MVYGRLLWTKIPHRRSAHFTILTPIILDRSSWIGAFHYITSDHLGSVIGGSPHFYLDRRISLYYSRSSLIAAFHYITTDHLGSVIGGSVILNRSSWIGPRAWLGSVIVDRSRRGSVTARRSSPRTHFTHAQTVKRPASSVQLPRACE